MPAPDYRPDIDGLRALAIGLVLLFHLSVPGFSGGFIGVDVFFVISGYLITGSILRHHHRGDFRFGRFYARRIRRLFPALFVTVAVTWAAGLWAVWPEDFVALGQSAGAALFSISNLVFFKNAGYWDTPVAYKPLLHTWSLGVEEQFYILWPALLVLVFGQFRGWRIRWALSFLVGGGFLATLVVQGFSPTAAFYLVFFRIFQFALGGWVWTLREMRLGAERSKGSKVAFPGFALVDGAALPVGLGALLASALYLGPDSSVPGLAVLPATLGTGLLLLTNPGASNSPSPRRWILQNATMRGVGVASYALYLVHWPVIALYQYQWGPDLSWPEQLGLLAISGILALMLHRGVEARFYTRNQDASPVPPSNAPLSDGALVGRALAAAGLFSAVALLPTWGDGWTWRFADLVFAPSQIDAGADARFTHIRGACRADNFLDDDSCRRDATQRILVLGDSQEIDAYNLLRGAFAQDPGVQLIRFGNLTKCALFWDEKRDFPRAAKSRCKKKMDDLIERKGIQEFDVVVLQRRDPFAKDKAETLRLMKYLKRAKPSLKVVLVLPFVQTQEDCPRLINKSGNPNACLRQENLQAFPPRTLKGPLRSEFLALADATVDRIALLCPNENPERCVSVAPDGTPFSWDREHLSLPYAEMTGRIWVEKNRQSIERLFSRPGGNNLQ
jgi:peptidoglycan/LPS O-acetylase OafA/YrhL